MSSRKSVIVVGAGVKGLYIAGELSKLGFHVTVLERSKTAGGKIKTIRSPTCFHGAFAEMGAMRILESNEVSLRLLENLSVKLFPFIESNENAPYAIKDQRGKTKDLNLGLLIDCGLVESSVLKKDNTLSRETSFSQILDLAFHNANEVRCQRSNGKPLTVLEYLSISGEQATVKKCAKAILDLKLGVKGVHNVADVDEFLKFKKLNTEKSFAVDGGFDNIIYEMTENLLKSNIKMHMKTEVRTVDYSRPECVSVSCKKIGLDRTETFISDAVLLACPSLHKIEFLPNLPRVHQETIKEKLYSGSAPAMKSVLRFDECFWQNSFHGGIVGGACWIGPTILNQVILPPLYCQEEGYLMIYLLGESVNDWLKYSVDDRISESLNAIGKLFPSMEGKTRKHFKDISEVVWNEAGSGAYFVFNAERVRDVLQPIDRLVFSPVPRAWIDDALKDGNVAIDQIQRTFNPRHRL